MLLTEGTYAGLELYGSATRTKDDGTDTFEIYLRDPEDYENTITDFLTAKTDKSFKFACRRLASYGWDPKENGYAFSKLNATDDRNPWFNAEQGRVAQIVGPVVIEPNTFNGKTNVQVAMVGNEQPFREQMPEADAMAFEMRLRSRFNLGSAPPATRKKPAPTTKPKAATPLAPTGTEGTDDSPY